jgi:hypothetical protein
MPKQLVRNQDLASDTARLNLLTNGGFEIWQRGNGPFTGANPQVADRWTANQQGSDVLSTSRDTTNVDAGSTACAAVTFTLGTGGGASGLYQTFVSPSENQQMIGRTITFSARIRTATANAVRIAIDNYYSGTHHYTYSASFHSGNGTYQTLTATAVVAAGVQYCQTYFLFSASCTAYIDNAMLVVGSQAADYAPLHPADDLARCLRYYERWVFPGGVVAAAAGYCYSTTTAQCIMHTKARLAVNPAQSAVSSPSDFTLSGASGNQIPVVALSVAQGSFDVFSLLVTVAGGLVAGNGTVLVSANANAWFAIEANP